ncbi:MAG: hypothetical protein CMO63_01945 [Verrucomicrobiales bacterium]|nr:hypothetical protein [Verrucomicrobiales bacterium]
MKTSFKRAARAAVISVVIFCVIGQLACGKKEATATDGDSTALTKPAQKTPTDTEGRIKLAYEYYRKQDFKKAAELFLKAASKGNPEAQFALGVMHQNGQGVPINFMEAAKWYEKSARQDNPLAQHLIGLAYKEGSGVPKDPAEAYKWLHLAAEHGLPEHQEARDYFATLITPDLVAEGLRRAEQFHMYELAALRKAREAEQAKQVSTPPGNGQAVNN